MKKKERVIVFDGEDKFIVKKNHTYNAATGEMQRVEPPANRISAVDNGVVDLASTTTVTSTTVTPEPVPQDAVTPEPFKAPDWKSLDCEQIEAELSTIRNFLMTARMQPEALAPYQRAIQDGQSELDSKCAKNPPALPDVPPTPTPTPTPVPAVPLVNLGQPPRAIGGGGAAGGEKKPEEKKKSSVLLWVLIAIGAAYLLSDKKS